MEIFFTKMHGAGNDFILIDCIEQPEVSGLNFEDMSKMLCDRRFGIGADQILLLYRSDTADFKMKIFNADGGEVEMCGNGIRCLAKYIWDKGISTKDTLAIETLAGIVKPERAGEMVRVDMGEPILEPENIPVNLPPHHPLTKGGQGGIIDYPLKIKDREFKITCVSMGNPHAVIFLSENISGFPVSIYGPEIEHHPLFPKRTNVGFVNIRNKKEMYMRVWERGSGETMACGTGASAVGVASMLKGLTDRKVTVHLKGGDLDVEWAQNNHVYMTGPAAEVFEGKLKISADRKKEHRRYIRQNQSILLEFAKKGEPNKTYNCVSRDISESGIGIISNYALETGQVITFKDKIGKFARKAAIVIWNKKIDNKYRVGLMFI